MKIKDIAKVNYKNLKVISFYTSSQKLKDISDIYGKYDNVDMEDLSYNNYHSYDARMSIHPDMYETIIKNYTKITMFAICRSRSNIKTCMKVLSILSGG